MIHNHSAANAKAPTTRPNLDDFAAWLMAGDNALIALWSLAKMLVINATNIRPADRRGFNPDQNFGMARA